jgi:hypothetical protein
LQLRPPGGEATTRSICFKFFAATVAVCFCIF